LSFESFAGSIPSFTCHTTLAMHWGAALSAGTRGAFSGWFRPAVTKHLSFIWFYPPADVSHGAGDGVGEKRQWVTFGGARAWGRR